jgi:hypothetical protein
LVARILTWINKALHLVFGAGLALLWRICSSARRIRLRVFVRSPAECAAGDPAPPGMAMNESQDH